MAPPYVPIMIPHHHKTQEDPMYRITVQSTPHREFHDEKVGVERAGSPMKTEDLLRMGRKMTIHQEEVKLNILKIIYFFLILSSLALDAFAWVTWAQTESYLLLAIAGTTVMTTFGSVLGLIGSFIAIQELKARPQNPSQLISNTPGQNLLILSFYFLLYIFSSYLVFGSGALFFQDQSLYFLEAKHSDEEAWAQSFNSKELGEVLDFTSLMITIAGYSCFITNVIIGLSIYYIFVLSAVWEVIHKVLMVICIVLLCLGLGILYMAGLGELMITYLDFDDIVPGWVSLAAVVVGGVICVSAFQGYYMGHTEYRGAIRTFMFIQLVVLGGSLVFAVGSLLAATRFKEKLNTSCYDTLALIDRDYTRVLGCDSKYKEVSSTEAGLSCPKEQLRVIWEMELDSGGVAFGCLNNECCGSLVASAKSVFDYMGIQALASVVIVSVALWGVSYLIEKLNKFGTSSNHDTDYRFLLSMLLFSTAIALLLYTNLRMQPRQPLHKEALMVVSNASVVDQRLMTPGNCFKGLMWSESEDGKCSGCDSGKTFVTVQMTNGKLYRLKPPSVNESDFSDSSWQFSASKPSLVHKAIEDLTVCPLCPNTDFSLSVSASQLDQSTQALTSIYNVTFGLSVKTNATQTVTGKVVGGTVANIPIFGDIGGNCPRIEGKTDTAGRFSLSFPQASDLSPYPVVISTADGAKRIQQIGGVPQAGVYIPALEQVPGSSLYSRITVRVVDCYHGFPIGNATVWLRESGNNVTGPALSVGESDRNGTVVFQEVPAGGYTLVGSAPGFLSDVVDVSVSGGAYLDQPLQLGHDSLSPHSARIHLTWSAADLDLDLRAAFQTSPNFYCHIYYAETYCGSAKLTKQTHPLLSGEVLTLKDVSAGQYLIYVTQYGKKGTVAKSKAEVKVYVAGASLPLLRIQVPMEGTGSPEE